jgi:hypothetical protein
MHNAYAKHVRIKCIVYGLQTHTHTHVVAQHMYPTCIYVRSTNTHIGTHTHTHMWWLSICIPHVYLCPLHKYTHRHTHTHICILHLHILLHELLVTYMPCRRACIQGTHVCLPVCMHACSCDTVWDLLTFAFIHKKRAFF